MTIPAPTPVFLLPPSVDLLDWGAGQLLERHAPQLPDLSTVTVLVPALPIVQPLRRELARRAGRGLLGPHILTLAGFANARASDGAPLGMLECRLHLAEALSRHRHFFPGQDSARMAEALFSLFEELSASNVDPGSDAAAFAARLQNAYGAKPLAWLSREAQIVQRLWQAFLEQTDRRNPASVYRQRLKDAFNTLNGKEQIYLLGFDRFSRSEAGAIAEALHPGRVELWLQGRLEGHDGEACRVLCQSLGVTPEQICAVGSPSENFPGRLLDAAFSESAPDPAGLPQSVVEACPLHLVEATGPEHEARCVDLAVRQALLDGARDIVVLTQDRRLARRLRALLERAGVPLQDHVGWALSTSRAAAALNSWLDCLDSRFHFRPLLELLKSGFVEIDPQALQHLERDLVYAKNIEGGLEILLDVAQDERLVGLLRKIQSVAALNVPSNHKPDGQGRIRTLIKALQELGLWERFRQDAAGVQLTQVLEQLHVALRRVSLPLDADGFRHLLDRTIESETFVPESRHGPVRLLPLEQSQALRCDVLILAGASRERLPGTLPADPFFNQTVRHELGLPGWTEHRAWTLARLCRVLQAAPRVWITYAAEFPDEPARPSPWLEALEMQAQAWNISLRNSELAHLADHPGTEVATSATPGWPAVPLPHPAPAAPPDLLLAELSASAHQSLLDCPYRFYAGKLLGLRSEQAPDEDPDRSDYGTRVHRILQAFTEPLAGLPAPFTERITVANRAQAQARFEELAEAVFARDLRTHTLALSWTTEFRASIPKLLDWLEQRPAPGTVQAEAKLEQILGPAHLVGRPDRLETYADGTVTVVDYKTGRVPKKADVEAGEDVQLLHYALLDERIRSAEYLPLRDGEKALMLTEPLEALRDEVRQRLESVLARLYTGAALPAQGDENT
ncbi:MAG: PD-(D/E)XK nuclease family protein, partial [Nevskiales bacterium]|nr:PD-(D/E)XK nuclease family protein [Nevskiales bacterium]